MADVLDTPTLAKGDEHSNGTPPAVVDAVPAGSLQAHLRAKRAQLQHRHTKDFEIPGYGGLLWATLRAIDDYTEVRAIVQRHESERDEATQELYVAADTLVDACVDVYAIEDDKPVSLHVKLGLGLAAYLGETVETDRQGVFAVLPNTMPLMTLFAEYETWLKTAGADTDTALVKGLSEGN